MYPSIPYDAGLKALREVLEKREKHTIPTSELIKIADFVPKNNYFEFIGQIKQQISGTAVGTKFAPTLRVFVMDKIETVFLETQEIQPLVWFRYIDDIFLSGHMVSKNFNNFNIFGVVLMSSILTSNLHMSLAKKALHFLTLKLVLKTVGLLQICM